MTEKIPDNIVGGFPKPGGSREDLKKSDEALNNLNTGTSPEEAHSMALNIDGSDKDMKPEAKGVQDAFSSELKDLNVGNTPVAAVVEGVNNTQHTSAELLADKQSRLRVLGAEVSKNRTDIPLEERQKMASEYLDLQDEIKNLRNAQNGAVNSIETQPVADAEKNKTPLRITLDASTEKKKSPFATLDVSKEKKDVQKEPKKADVVVSPVVENKGAVKTAPEVKKDAAVEKEKYSPAQLLNAAEIFCKYNPFGYKNDAEKATAQAKAIELLKKEHSPEEIAAAVRVADVRDNMRGLTDRARSVEEQYKNAKGNPNADISQATAKHDQQIENIKKDKKLLENEYGDLLRNLKIENIKNQLANIQKFREHADFPEKVQNVEKTAFAMINAEEMRWQDARVDANRKVNPKGWDHVANFFSRVGEKASKSKLLGGYFRMNRHVRTACTAAIIGAGTAVMLPSAVIAAGVGTAGYLGVKMVNALTGGAFSYQLSKRIFQPLGEKAHKGDTKKTTEKLQGEVLEDENVRKLEQVARGEMSQEEMDEILGKIADKNIEVGEKYAKEMRRHRAYYKANRFLGTLAAGLIGGRAAVATTDYLLGPGMLNVFGVKGAGVAEVVPDHKGGAAPLPEGPKGTTPEISPETMKIGTVGEGKGVEHVFRRQLELSPEKFGFKGNIADKAAIHEWSGGEAHRIAIENKYINFDGNGKEIRVLDIGPDGAKGNPAYILETDGSGKVSVKEFLDGKQMDTGIARNQYEYLYDKPKVVADAPVAETPVMEEVVVTGKSEMMPIESLGMHTSAANIPDHLEVPPSVQRVNIFENLNKTVPDMEQAADHFEKLSLSQQEEFLYGAKMKGVAEQVQYLQKNNLLTNVSDQETEALGKINEHWTEMSRIFEENENNFGAVVKGTVQLNNAGLEKLLSTKVNKIWDVYNTPQDARILDFVKSVNPSATELNSGASIGDVLKTRFVDGEFLKAAQIDSVLKM